MASPERCTADNYWMWNCRSQYIANKCTMLDGFTINCRNDCSRTGDVATIGQKSQCLTVERRYKVNINMYTATVYILKWNKCNDSIKGISTNLDEFSLFRVLTIIIFVTVMVITTTIFSVHILIHIIFII